MQRRRFYIKGHEPGGISVSWPLLMIVGAVLLLLAAPHYLTLIPAGVSITLGLYMLVKGSRPELFVELSDDHLIINMPARNQIPYARISCAKIPIVQYGDLRRTFENVAAAHSRFFGGNLEQIGPKGSKFPNTVDITFTRRLWLFRPFPPILVPMRHWRIMALNDADTFADELNRRLPSRCAE